MHPLIPIIHPSLNGTIHSNETLHIHYFHSCFMRSFIHYFMHPLLPTCNASSKIPLNPQCYHYSHPYITCAHYGTRTNIHAVHVHHTCSIINHSNSFTMFISTVTTTKANAWHLALINYTHSLKFPNTVSIKRDPVMLNHTHTHMYTVQCV